MTDSATYSALKMSSSERSTCKFRRKKTAKKADLKNKGGACAWSLRDGATWAAPVFLSGPPLLEL